MSMLTGRHSGSFESIWEQDMRRISQYGAAEYLAQLEAAELGDGFWEVQLPQNLDTSSSISPYFQAFVAAQIASGARGFLSKSIKIATMQEHSGDIHHVIPKNYLVRAGITDRSEYNQVANYAITETAINIQILDAPPEAYLGRVAQQIETGELDLGEIVHESDLAANLAENALPENLASVTADNYFEFLTNRRSLMAQTIRRYYEAL